MNTMHGLSARQEKGFTLVELIVVLLILGILAATIAPRFFDFSGKARAAAVKSLAGSLSTASQLTHAVQVTSGLGSASTVTLEGVGITMALGYPELSSIANAVTFDSTLFSSVDISSGYATAWVIPTATTSGDCAASYTPPATAGTVPTIVYTTTGCD